MSTLDAPIMETTLPTGEPSARGKVRDIYDFGDRLVIVATDRLSAFDWINPVGIPGKGKILTQISLWWFEQMADICPHHILASELADMPGDFKDQPEMFEGRSILVRKCDMLPVEFVIRGYLAGSGWKEYREQGTVCAIPLPEGLRESSILPEPLYTPATKAETGHDINIHPDEAGRIIGAELNAEAAALSRRIYERGRDIAADRGLILCDTKFEFGLWNGALMLADEILTPDSSRYWPAEGYEPGHAQPSFDKQFVRDFLETTGWDKNSPPPPLPEDIVLKTREKYVEAYQLLTGRSDLA
jgi:phosphoribosylaminoimidazole-succinocarboxamide synthase